jgi:alcohol dehydrogenase
MMQQGQLKSVVDKSFPLEDIVGAMEYSISGRAKGKIVIAIG